MREPVLLVDVESIHVGAKTDGPVAWLVALQRPDDAGAGKAAMDLDAELGEALGDERGGAMLVEGGLGVGVDVAAPPGQICVVVGNAVDDGHVRVLRFDWVAGRAPPASCARSRAPITASMAAACPPRRHGRQQGFLRPHAARAPRSGSVHWR